MKRMKKRSTALFIILAILIILTCIILSIKLWSEAKYDYTETGYDYGSILTIEETKYIELDKSMYEEIAEKLLKEKNYNPNHKFILKIRYPYIDEMWKYNIYGNENLGERILLIGEDSSIIDSNRTEAYFCRQDVFKSLKDELESLEGVDLEIFLD